MPSFSAHLADAFRGLAIGLQQGKRSGASPDGDLCYDEASIVDRHHVQTAEQDAAGFVVR